MSEVLEETLSERCRRLEAFETPRWAIDAVLDVEITTPSILDPCSGLGAIGEVCRDRGLAVTEVDIEDWSKRFPAASRVGEMTFFQEDFFEWRHDLTLHTVVMNPPFSMAEDFVSRAQALNARKIICFQRQGWRESGERRKWWDQNSPARVWVCGARATCWRFDLMDCQHPDGEAACPNANRSGKRVDKDLGCQHCMGNSPTSNAWYVWERGHKGAEVTSAIYPKGGRYE